MAIDATTLERVKTVLNKDQNDVGDDELISGLITETTRQMEAYMGTALELTARTEIRDIDKYQKSFWLYHAPIASIASVKTRSKVSTAWADVDALDAVLYDFDAEAGRLLLDYTLNFGPLSMQVIYTAGFASTTGALESSFLDITSACDRQVAYAYGRRKQPEASSVGIAGGSQGIQSELRMLRAVKETLSPYRRVFLG